MAAEPPSGTGDPRRQGRLAVDVDGQDGPGVADRPHARRGGRRVSLWRNRDFTAFWVAETVSLLGTQVTFVALPLIAVLLLDASAAELGVLRFVEYLPFLATTLLFGVWADRSRRRPLMVASYVLRGVLVLAVPVLAVLGGLRMSLLAGVAFGVGVGAALFEVCWQSYVPNIVGRDRLVEAMGKVATSHSSAEVAGPGIGGLLIHLVGAPFALLLDGASYVVGVVALLRIRHVEPAPAPRRRHVVRELLEGIRFMFGQPYIRAVVFSATMGNFFSLVTETAFLLYAVQVLNLGPGLIGMVFTAVGAGGLIGALLANTFARRWPLGRVYLVARTGGGLAGMLLPLATGPTPIAVAMCMASFFLVQASVANTNVLNATLRQSLSPDHIRGRMNASARTLVFGALPLGGLAGGLLGDSLGLQATLWIGAVGWLASIVPILASPIPTLRGIPAPPDAVPGGVAAR